MSASHVARNGGLLGPAKWPRVVLYTERVRWLDAWVRGILDWSGPAAQGMFAVALVNLGILGHAWPNWALLTGIVILSALWWLCVARAFRRVRSASGRDRARG